MIRFKKVIRGFLLLFLMFLATIGIGIVGSVPLQPTAKKEDKNEIKTELFESKHTKNSLQQSDRKQ